VCPEIFYSGVWILEMYFRGVTPGVFQRVCILEMHSRGTTPGAFCVSGDFYSGVWISEMYFGGISPGAFRVSGDFYSGVWISEDVLQRNHSRSVSVVKEVSIGHGETV
jgi:hypothetical protein